jgi:hypothetical protein
VIKVEKLCSSIARQAKPGQDETYLPAAIWGAKWLRISPVIALNAANTAARNLFLDMIFKEH